MIIGLHGFAHSGKGTFTKELIRLRRADHLATQEFSFAEPIRLFLCSLMGVPREDWDRVKDTPHPIFGGKTPRLAAQTLGTEWGRGMNDKLWTTICMRDASAFADRFGVAIVSDVRYVNEAEAVRGAGGAIVHLVRPGQERIAESDHSSEEVLPDELIDMTCQNDGPIISAVQRVASVYPMLGVNGLAAA